MKTALSMAALVVLLAAGCESSSVAEQAKVTTSAKPTTRLYVHTIPKGAEVSLDGERKGKSPQLIPVPPGADRMIVEMELEGYEKGKREVVIQGGRIIRVEFRFTKKAQPPAESVAAPQPPRILLYLVVGKDGMTFQGKDTTWDELAKLLEKVPASKNTVLHIARAPGEMTAEHWDQAVGRAIKLIKRFGFGNLSQIGVHPLGFSGPAKPHSVCLVVGKDRMTFQGEDTTWEELPKLLEKIADRQRTVLNFARAPGELAVKQWHQARSRAVGLAERFGFDHLSDIGQHPLGSKWEETHTLSDAKAQSPRQALIWERVMNPPKGWTIEKSFIVPPDQTAAIGKKLGGPIKRLSNTIYSAHGQRVQVNVIECWTNPDAEDIHKNVLATKGDPAYALELGDTIVEFVGTFDVAFAKRAARELLQPQSDEPKQVSFGPVIEKSLTAPSKREAELLDLDTGKRATMEEYFGHDDARTHRWIREHGTDALGVRQRQGAAILLFDVAVYENPSIRWDGITAEELARHRQLHHTEARIVTTLAAKDPSELPKTCLFRTREGGRGVLQLVGAEGSDFVKIRYRSVRETGVERRAPTPEQKTVRLASGPSFARVVSNDKAGRDWFYDLDTGKLHTLPWKLKATRKPEAILAWVRNSGIDISAVKASTAAVDGCDVRVAPIAVASWDALTPAAVREAIERLPDGPLPAEVPNVQFGAKGTIYTFKTREGGLGVLQVITNPDGKGVTVRYRLADRSPAEWSASAARATSAELARAEKGRLPDTKAQPPVHPSPIPAGQIWDRVMNPPEGWKVEKSFIVPEDQTAAIGKKLEGRIKKLSNTICSAHGQRVQVNVFECETGPDAEKVHKAVLAVKGDPAYALRFDNTIVEFVGTFDVAFAKRAARELGLQPVPDRPKGVSFGPVIEQSLSGPLKAVAELLDLDTGRRAKREDFGRNDRETHRWIRDQRLDLLGARERAGAGVLLFDVAVWANPSLDWDKITAPEVRDHQALAQTEPQTITAVAAEDLSKLPLTCLFRTREGALGVLQLVGVEGPRAVKIRYKLVRLPPQQTVRQVIYKFAKACVESDKDTVANLIHEKSQHLLIQIDELREIMSEGIKPAEIDQIIVRGDRALAATKLTQLRHRQYPRPVCLVYILEKQGGSWVLRDVDVEDKPGLADEIHRFNVDTSPRGAARQGGMPAAASRAKQLKANIDSFMLTLARYSGEQPPDPPQQSLVLHVPTNGFKHTRAVQIDKRQAEQIIDHLAADGFLNSFHNMQEWKFIEAPRGAHYRLSVQAGDAHFAQHFSWNRTMLSRLQELRNVLRGEAAEAMDQLLGPPAPAEKGSPE